ncbi:hypothetical protein B0H10DRAFT_1961436 [Mycena sp. CBHHK59/15]|nr:hypothetical protein B0H10DRAFT_1961436 [Mycena sp. CBHHK59/15]
MPSFATSCDTPVSTGFDGRAARSCVSLDWVINSGLPTRGSQLSGPVTLPCNTGVISLLLLDVPVTVSLPSDLVLGLDWLHLVRDSAHQVVVHLSCGSLDLRTLGSASAQSSSIVSASLPLALMFQAGIGGHLSASSVSTGGPSAVPAPSPMPSTRGIDAVAPGIPRTRETQTSRTRDGISGQDVQTAGTPAAPHTRGIQILKMDRDWIINERDPFVCISLQDKIAVVHFLVINHQIDVLALRKMTVRHQRALLRGCHDRFCIKNLAIKLGISKMSPGTFVSTIQG